MITTASQILSTTGSTFAAPGLLSRVHRFSVAEYHDLGRLGILTPEHKVELLHGWIVKKMTVNPAHAQAVHRLSKLLTRVLSETWDVRSQNPVTLTESEPEPDIVVAIGPDVRYDEMHPTPNEIELIIEVAGASLEHDLTTKLAVYANAKIPQYWVVNLTDWCVEVFTLPRAGKTPKYRHHVTVNTFGHITLSLRGKAIGTISVREFLP